MSLHHHEIAEADHRILDPFSEDKLRLLGEAAQVRAGDQVLDLACGKGELLCRWAEWFGSRGVGVDLSQVFLASAQVRAVELGVADRVAFVQGDAGAYDPERGGFDLACCLGATWIGGGIAGTVELLRMAIRDGGRIVIGEPFWIDPPPEEALAAYGFGADDYSSLDGTRGRLEAAGLELVELVVASPDDWDRYRARQWRTVSAWLVANADDPEHDAMVRFLEEGRRAYLRWGRRYLGWGVFVARPR